MEKILTNLKESIDNQAFITAWDAKGVLNLQLAGSFEYYIVSLLSEKFLLVKPLEEMTVKKVAVRMERIQEKTGLDVVLLLEDTTGYKVKKFLENRIPFIVTDKQMYLPFMALQIKKQRKTEKSDVLHEKFTAATQLLYLFFLYSNQKKFGTEELAKTLGLSNMTVLRATEELNKIGLLHCQIGGKTGRKKLFQPIEKKTYYQIGKKYLSSPVKKNVYVEQIPQNCKVYKSGLTALEEQTMLGEPLQEVYAVGPKSEKELLKVRITKEKAMEEAKPMIQVMKYDIGVITETSYVDPVTLILSLEEQDDRIEMAIEELMEETEWYAE